MMASGYHRRKRSGLEIKLDILRACLKPNLLTRIMYASNIAYAPVRSYLDELIDRGLVEEQKQEVHLGRGRQDRRLVGFYVITDKGLRALEQAEGLKEVLVG